MSLAVIDFKITPVAVALDIKGPLELLLLRPIGLLVDFTRQGMFLFQLSCLTVKSLFIRFTRSAIFNYLALKMGAKSSNYKSPFP